MNDTIKPLHAVAVLALAALGFAGGLYFLQGQRAEEPVAQAPAVPAVVEEPKEPAKEPEKKDEPPPIRRVPQEPRVLVPPNNGFNLGFNNNPPPGPWGSRSMWGLPSPGRLNAKQKQALGMLGTANNTHDYRFGGSMVLGDGSTIPGVPALKPKEIEDKVMGEIREKGLAEGFETAVRFLALPHNLDRLTLQVTVTPEWTDVLAILGKSEATSQDDIYLDKPPAKANDYYRITWHRYGWLKFGVAKGKVLAIRADMSHAPLVAAEDVAGGRSPPDPARVAARQKKQRPPGAPPREVDALKMLGQASSVQVTTRKTLKADPKLDGLVRDAQRLSGQDLYPNMVQTARELKQSFYSEYLIVTPSKSPTLQQIQEVMDETKFIMDDKTTMPGQNLKWHKYHWLEFGVVNGQVERVRISVAFTPREGF